ncbi:helix-turn-helix transcriptional regulator [Gloeocapsopsis crepidinum LEGE 06123]|uniref:Helix-turn-helix transcriptional regulator n=1 Tax=Gloeocapsopsis crepidinum LEGE 06123 TaxID=588587 RepID=A0ABR9ULY3_9CHRO|nr:AraC family transcriptional regulator [Gloeocapsopsis crepidinum]MBE9189292.1 helix-turn-helix transcriptional regulator [Gloeocapsopsis crepidinum LEGE 06123]
MPVSLSADAHQKLWESHKSQIIDPFDVIQQCPPQLGKGQRRWIHLRQGILLLIHDYELHDHLWLEGEEPREDYPWLEFGFQLSGYCLGENGDIRGADEYFICVNGVSDDTTQRLAGQQTLQVDIHFTQSSIVQEFIADRLDRLPSAIRHLFEALADSNTASLPSSFIQLCNDIGQQYADLRLTLTPDMQLALQQLLHCPYHSLTKQLYLESKSLELVALALEQFVEQVADPHPYLRSVQGLRPDDIERIYQAREILHHNLENPPSLIALARQVGLNDYKLKIGFRQVFKTTVFGYLRNCRLEQARQLLTEQQMSVTEISNAVGYTSLSSFNAAFRKKFGFNPSACLERLSRPMSITVRS